LVVNGGFDTDSDWTKGTGWSIGGGLLNSVATTNTRADNSNTLTEGSAYRNTFELLNYVSGSVRIESGSGLGTVRASNGIFTENLTDSGGNQFTILRGDFTNGFDGSIDNVSVKRILEIAP